MEPDTGTAGASANSSPGQPAAAPALAGRARNLGAAGLTLLLDALLADAALETYSSGGQGRVATVLLVGAYLAATAWLVQQRAPFGRRPGWLTLPATAFSLLLVVLVVTASGPEGMTRGVRLAGQPTPVVLDGALTFVVLLAAFSLLRAGGARWWWRVLLGGLGAYGIAALGMATAAAMPFPEMLRGGRAFWHPLPYWLQGPFIGGLVLIPSALVWEIGHALARLVVRGRVALMIVLALGLWIAWLGVSGAATR